MKSTTFIIWVVSVLLLTSCRIVLPRYGNPLHGSDLPYLSKPNWHDSIKVENYISGSFYQGITYEDEDKNNLCELIFYRSKTFKHYNFSYGTMGYFGQYLVNHISIPKYNGIKNFGGLCFIGSANFNIPFHYADWRILGMNSTINNEFGNYYNFRKTSRNNGEIVNLNSKRISMSFDLNTEISFKLKNYSSIGLLIGLSASTLNIDAPSNDKSISSGLDYYYFLRSNLYIRTKNIIISVNGNIGYGFPVGIGISYRIPYFQ